MRDSVRKSDNGADPHGGYDVAERDKLISGCDRKGILAGRNHGGTIGTEEINDGRGVDLFLLCEEQR